MKISGDRLLVYAAVLAAIAGLVLLGLGVGGCQTWPPWPWPTPTNAPPVVVIPTNAPTPPATNPPPITATTEWRGCLFTQQTNGVADSQMGYFEIHGQSDEGAIRTRWAVAINAAGGNVLSYIRGNYQKGNTVLEMILCGRKHPTDGHYFPIGPDGEVDLAMYFSQHYGITRHFCWIWNDDNSMPIAQKTVTDCVLSYDGSRLGLSNVAFGVCLEANEIMSAQQAATALAWIRAASPTSRAVVGSSSADWLIAVSDLAPAGCYYWLEAITESSKNPITDPVTMANLKQKLLDPADKVAAKVGKAHVICGEHYSPDVAVRRQVTAAIRAAGYEDGSGQYH